MSSYFPGLLLLPIIIITDVPTLKKKILDAHLSYFPGWNIGQNNSVFTDLQADASATEMP